MGETNVASTSAEVTAALKPSYFVDSDSPAIFEYAERVCEGALSPREQAVRLYYAVRDGLWYDPYSFGRDRDRFRASNVAGLDRAFCVPKAILLAAAARNRGIPARLGYADVRNHLTSEKLRESMGTDLFEERYHPMQNREFEFRSDIVKPIDQLRSATSINAEIMQKSGEVGCIEPGAYADLIAIEGNPLDDIHLMTRPDENFSMIMKGGEFVRNRI